MRLLKPHWVTHGAASKKDILPRPIYTLDIHPDGKRLATGGLTDGGGIVILWDMTVIREPCQGTPISPKLFQMDNHQACVNCVRWSPTGRYLASGGMDRVIMLWVKTTAGARSSGIFGATEKMKFSEHWRCSTVLRHHTGDIIDLAWAQDGNRLASASIDNTVVIWKATGTTQQPFQCVAVLRGHKGPVKGVTWDPAGRYLATQADDVGVRIWRTADWQPESKISAPFINASDQSQVTRLSWSPDGSVIVAPHATNNKFPTAQLITRNRWQTGLDLVGHEKHVTCARYNPNLLKKTSVSGSSAMICLALGSKDRSLSVWSTLGRRALVVIRDLFSSSVTDLAWSANGSELLASSLDGSISYMHFSKEELGEPMKIDEVARLHRKSYGQSLLDGLLMPQPSLDTSLNGSKIHRAGTDPKSTADINGAIVLETPEALALQRTQAELREKLNATSGPTASATSSLASPNNHHNNSSLPKPSVQTEVRTKDGRRRITPSFLGSLDCLDEEPPSTFVSATAKEPTNSSDSNHSASKVLNSSQPQQQSITQSVGSNTNNAAATPKAQESSQSAKNCSASDVTKSFAKFDLHMHPPVCSPAQTTAAQTAKPSTDSNQDSPSAPPKKRKRIELTTVSTPNDEIEKVRQDETKENESKEKPPQKEKKNKKKARAKVFIDDGEDEEGSANTTRLSDSLASPAKKSQVKAAVVERAGPAQQTATASAPDQLEACGNRAQFVCCHATEGPIIITIVNAESGGTAKAPGTLHQINANRPSEGNSKLLWTTSCSDRFTCHTNNDNWLAVGDAQSRVRLLYCTGFPICPPIILDSVPQHLATTVSPFSSAASISFDCSTNPEPPTLLATVTASGRLTVFSLPSFLMRGARPTLSRSLDAVLPSVLVETRIEARSGVASLEFPSSFRHPVVRLHSGSCLLFHTDRRIWIELFSGEASGSAVGYKMRVAVSLSRISPPGPLAAMQRFGKLGKNFEAAADAPTTTPAYRRALKEFLEAQVQLAELFGSPAEFKFWLLRWFRHLIENDEDEMVRQICWDFIGPFSPVSQTSWEPTVKGFSKRALMKELITLFALNLRMQRLYVEMKELLEQTQVDL